MVKACSDINILSSPFAGSYNQGVREGLELAARIADRHSALHAHYADEIGDSMPSSAHSFLMQKLAARQMAEKIRDAIDGIATPGRTVVIA